MVRTYFIYHRELYQKEFSSDPPFALCFLFCFSHPARLSSMFDAFFILCLGRALPLSLSLSPKIFLCVGEFPGIWGSHSGFSWENSSLGNCSRSKPGALSCISMRDQHHPPQSSVEIPGACSMRRKTAGKKQNWSQDGPFLLRSPRKAEKTFRIGFFRVSAVAVLASP